VAIWAKIVDYSCCSNLPLPIHWTKGDRTIVFVLRDEPGVEMALDRRVKLATILLGCCLTDFSSVGCAGRSILPRGRYAVEADDAACGGGCQVRAGRVVRCRDRNCKQHGLNDRGGSDGPNGPNGPQAEPDPGTILAGRFHPVPTRPVFGFVGANATEPVQVIPVPTPAPLPPPSEEPQELPELPAVQEPVPVEPTEARRRDRSPSRGQRVNVIPASASFLTR
jgi:hypothetical protein